MSADEKSDGEGKSESSTHSSNNTSHSDNSNTLEVQAHKLQTSHLLERLLNVFTVLECFIYNSIVSMQLHSTKQENNSINVTKFFDSETRFPL